jgi:hypothetical protein
MKTVHGGHAHPHLTLASHLCRMLCILMFQVTFSNRNRHGGHAYPYPTSEIKFEQRSRLISSTKI